MQRSIHISKHLVMRRMACHWVLFACSQSKTERAEQAGRGRANRSARACMPWWTIGANGTQELVKAGGASRTSGDGEQRVGEEVRTDGGDYKM